MQEGRTMSPLGPILGEEADLRVGVPVPLHQDRRHVLLQVRTADPFIRYEHLREHSSPLVDDDVEEDTRAKMKRVEKTEIVEEEDENENGICERINERIRGSRSEMEDDDEEDMEDNEEEVEKRNGTYHEDEDVEVDVCRDGDESNPSSPVDLTASSRCSGTDQYLHPFANRGIHPFSCLQNGGSGIGGQAPGHATPVYLSGHAATGSTVVTVCNANNVSKTNGPTGNITTTASSVQSNKRGLAFSVENILDPNKFTGGRVIHGRMQHRRRRRAGSIHEGKYRYPNTMI